MVNRLIHPLKTHNERQILLILIGTAFILRLYAVLMAQGIAYDSAAYGFMARDFIKGNIEKALAIPGHPLYPFLIFLFTTDTAQVEMTGRLISLFFGTLTILPLYLLAKETVDQRAALFSTLFYTFHPYLVTYSAMMLTEATYWGLLVLSVYFFWTGLKRDTIWRMALSGAFLGFAYLTRPEGIGYLVVYLAWLIVDIFFKRRWAKPLVSIGVMISSVLIIGSPYLIYVHQETGKWWISKKAVEVQSLLLDKDEGVDSSSKEVVPSDPQRSNSKIAWVARNVLHHFPSVLYHYLRAYHFSLWSVLLFGLIRIRQKGLPFESFLSSLVLFHMLSLATFLPSTIRFSVPMIPLSLFWAGTGVLEMKRFLEKPKGLISEKAIGWLMAIILLVQLPLGLKPERGHRAFQKQVGVWLKQNTPSNAIIMSNSPQEIFYADREFIMLPQGISPSQDSRKSYDEVIHYAKSKGVRYLLINKNTRERNSGFMDILQSKDRSPLRDLREVFRREDLELIIYEVVD